MKTRSVHWHKPLFTNSTLKTLDLRGNAIGAKGMVALSAAFCVNSTPDHLDFGFNLISPEGMESISAALTHNSSLNHLNIHSGNSCPR